MHIDHSLNLNLNMKFQLLQVEEIFQCSRMIVLWVVIAISIFTKHTAICKTHETVSVFRVDRKPTDWIGVKSGKVKGT